MTVLERPVSHPGGGSLLQERQKYFRVQPNLIKEHEENRRNKIPNKKNKGWSKKHANLKFAFWNPWSYSNERHEYCKSLGYDVLGLGELHNMQDKQHYKGRRWVNSEVAKLDETGCSTDKAAGVAILLSNRAADKVLDKDSVGTRIAYVRLKGPMCNIFFIAAYIPHKGRTSAPFAEDTLQELKQLLDTVPAGDCVVLCGDFNCQLQRNVEGLTGKWAMTKRPDNGHGEKVLEMMRAYDLFAVDTLFKPRTRGRKGSRKVNNATYIPKDKAKRPTKLDYFLVSSRWKSMVINSEVKWGAPMHRFGQQFDHGLLSVT